MDTLAKHTLHTEKIKKLINSLANKLAHVPKDKLGEPLFAMCK